MPAPHVRNSADIHFVPAGYGQPDFGTVLGDAMQGPGKFELSRRDVLKLGAAATAAPLVTNAQPAAADTAVINTVTLNVNGKTHALEIDTRTTLLDALRDNLQLTGSNQGCEHG